MLHSTKLSSFSKSLKLASANNAILCKYIDTKINKRASQVCFHTLRRDFQKLHLSLAKCNYSPLCSVKYSTEEIPPLPPPPPPQSDVFGALGGLKYEAAELSYDELKEEERLKTLGGQVPRKLKPSPGQYAAMIKTYITKGDIASAENVLLECRKNHDKPNSYMLALVMRAFALQGDVKQSYKYFIQMKNMNYKIGPNVYTTMIHACANSLKTEKALMYLDRVMETMKNNNQKMNHAHYNVLIRAYGCHGRYDEALKLVQSMMDKKMKIGISTLNSLMFAANSNTESGLKHVLSIWQLMRKLTVPPDLFTYNLLLRAIRDTNFGYDCSVNQLLLPIADCPAIITDNNRPDLLLYPPVISSLPFKNIHKEPPPLLDAPKTECDNFKSEESTDLTVINKFVQELPPEIANLNLDAVLKQNKLILFGGVEGFLDKMKNDRIQPNVKTVTYLIQLVPDSVVAENLIIKYAKSQNLILDIDFYNMLIKKRALRGALKEAKDVLNDIHRADLKPNIVTYGVLAFTCKTASQSMDLINSMDATGHTINKYIADTLLNCAFLRRDFIFILRLMEILLKKRVRLGESVFEKLDAFKLKMTGLVRMKNPISRKENFKTGFAKFNLRYKQWQGEMNRVIMTEKVSKQK